MDLVHSGTDDLAAALVTAHRDAGGDPGDDALLSVLRRLPRVGSGKGGLPAGRRAA